MRKMLIAAAVATAIVGSGYAFGGGERSYVEYRYTVDEGDTVWDVAEKIALPSEDVRDIVRRICEDNQLKNAQIRPGEELKVRVLQKEREVPKSE